MDLKALYSESDNKTEYILNKNIMLVQWKDERFS